MVKKVTNSKGYVHHSLVADIATDMIKQQKSKMFSNKNKMMLSLNIENFKNNILKSDHVYGLNLSYIKLSAVINLPHIVWRKLTKHLLNNVWIECRGY